MTVRRYKLNHIITHCEIIYTASKLKPGNCLFCLKIDPHQKNMRYFVFLWIIIPSPVLKHTLNDMFLFVCLTVSMSSFVGWVTLRTSIRNVRKQNALIRSNAPAVNVVSRRQRYHEQINVDCSKCGRRKIDIISRTKHVH